MTVQNGTEQDPRFNAEHSTPMEQPVLPPYVQLYKSPQRAHARSLTGLVFFREEKTGELFLSSIAYDSLKVWKLGDYIINEENGSESLELSDTGNPNELARWGCGGCAIQSWDANPREQVIVAVSIDSTFHVATISRDENDDVVPKVESYPNQMMKVWFVRISPDRQNFLSVNFSGYLELLNRSGETVRSVLADKVSLTSALAYGTKWIALGTIQGHINIHDSDSFLFMYSIEAHSMKVRCVEFAAEPKYLLTGGDDKIIKLYTLTEARAQFTRMFCGHKGSIQCIVFDVASTYERFASCSTDNTLILWLFSTGEKLHVFECDASTNDALRCAAFSPYGDVLAAGTMEATLFLFRIQQPEQIFDPDADKFLTEQPSTTMEPIYGAYDGDVAEVLSGDVEGSEGLNSDIYGDAIGMHAMDWTAETEMVIREDENGLNMPETADEDRSEERTEQQEWTEPQQQQSEAEAESTNIERFNDTDDFDAYDELERQLGVD